MFRNAYQNGMFTVFYSCGPKPLAIWDICTKDGYINKFLDPDIKSMVLEIGGTNISTTYMICPKGKEVLGIKMPFLVMVVKNLKKYFSFEVTVLDETNTRRRFRISNFQSTTQIMPLCTAMPISLADGWNRIQFNMVEFMQRAYRKHFIEVHKLKINANVRIRRVYFADGLLPEHKLPIEYRLFFPNSSKGTTIKGELEGKENVDPKTPAQVVDTDKENDDLSGLSKMLFLSSSPSLTNIRVKDSGYIPPVPADDEESIPQSEDSFHEENIKETPKIDLLSTIDEGGEKSTDIAATEASLITSLRVNPVDNLKVHTKEPTAATEELTAAHVEVATDTNEIEISTENPAATQIKVASVMNTEPSPEIAIEVPTYKAT